MFSAVVNMNSQKRAGDADMKCMDYVILHGLAFFLPGGNVCFTYDKVPLSKDHC